MTRRALAGEIADCIGFVLFLALFFVLAYAAMPYQPPLQ
jgi:hypothetical protein